MSNQYLDAAKTVIDGIGGKDNLQAATHCATRLRLVLKDDSKINQDIIDNSDMIKGSFLTGGQYQLIIGTGTVNKVYAELVNLTGAQQVSKDEAKNLAGEKGNLFVRFVKTLSDIFVPLIPAIVAGGLLMGIGNLFNAKGLFVEGMSLIEAHPEWADMASIIDTFANAPFVFLPVLVAFSATRVFGGNAFLGAALGMLMVHPALMNFYVYAGGGAAEVGYWHVFGLDIAKVGYQGTVLPILVMAWVLATIENFFHKIIPAAFDLLLTPLFALFITAFITFAFTGPILRDAGDLLAQGLNWLYSTGGAVGSAIFGFLYAPVVITGMHQSFPAIETKLLADMTNGIGNGTFIFPIAAMSNMAQGGATWAAFFTTKDKKLKGIASAGGTSAVLGITEPAMFGVNLKLRYPFYAAIVAAAIASGFIALFGTKAVALGAAGIPGIISIGAQWWTPYIIGMIIAFGLSFVGTFLLSRTKYNPEKVSADTEGAVMTSAAPAAASAAPAAAASASASGVVDADWVMPIQGKTMPLSEIPDPAFASGAMGAGFGIEPSGGQVVSPVAGSVTVVFPTKHAIGLTTDKGEELLIHVGIDTVNLNGEGFETLVNVGDKVKPGTPLLNVNWDSVKAKAPSIVTPIIFSSMDAGQQIDIQNGKPVVVG